MIWFDRHNILTRQRYHFSQLLTEPGVNGVRQTEIHTTEPLVPESVVYEVEMATEEQKYTTYNVCVELQQNSLKVDTGQFVLNYKNVLILIVVTRNCLTNGRSKSLYLFIRRAMKRINYWGMFLS